MTNGNASETNGITSETNGNGLLPCWHCGGDAEVSYGVGDYDYDGGDRWRFYRAKVTCRCGSELRVENDGDEYLPLESALDFAVEAWNTRFASPTRRDMPEQGRGVLLQRGNCPFGVYMKDDVRRPYTSALFTEPRHMACEREECMMWRGGDCVIAAAALAVAGRRPDDGE